MNKITFLFLINFSYIISYSQCWSNVSTGEEHTIGIGVDNSLWSWGRSQAGQLGLGNLSSKNVPSKVGSDLNWSKISSGNAHNLALKIDGTLWVWGRNTTGQLGNPAIGQNILVPTQLGTDNGWVFISAGDDYSIALKTNGTLWAWGDNVYGQLGNNTFGTGNFLTTPTQIGTDTDWTYVSGGKTHTMALKNNGTLWGWGQNNFGKLGDGSIIDKIVPSRIGTASDWLTVEVAINHSIALKTNGSLWTWGDNTDGKLGNGLNGAVAAQSAPINIDAGNTFLKITRGQRHTLVKRANGKLWSWGANVSGQLGDNTFLPKFNPTAVSSIIDTWEFISSRVSHCAALKSDGTLYMWGSNSQGQLGDASLITKKIPTLIACPVLANNQFNLTNGFSIYPNPTNSLLNVEMVDSLELSKIQIVDVTGKIVLEQNQDLNIINVENLANGLYIIQMYSENKSFTGKFIKN